MPYTSSKCVAKGELLAAFHQVWQKWSIFFPYLNSIKKKTITQYKSCQTAYLDQSPSYSKSKVCTFQPKLPINSDYLVVNGEVVRAQLSISWGA